MRTGTTEPRLRNLWISRVDGRHAPGDNLAQVPVTLHRLQPEATEKWVNQLSDWEGDWEGLGVGRLPDLDALVLVEPQGVRSWTSKMAAGLLDESAGLESRWFAGGMATDYGPVRRVARPDTASI